MQIGTRVLDLESHQTFKIFLFFYTLVAIIFFSFFLVLKENKNLV